MPPPPPSSRSPSPSLSPASTPSPSTFLASASAAGGPGAPDRPPPAHHLGLRLTVPDTPDAADLERIDAALGAANGVAAPLHEVRPLACLLHPLRPASAPRWPDAGTEEGLEEGREAGHAVGGAVGRTWGRCAELQQLWVHESLRRQGLGAQLVRAFEAQAAARGCTLVYLETFSFQAPSLYRALGYETLATLEGFAPGIAKFIMARRLIEATLSSGAQTGSGPAPALAPDRG